MHPARKPMPPACNSMHLSLQLHAPRPLATPPACNSMHPARNRRHAAARSPMHPALNRMHPAHCPHAYRACSPTRVQPRTPSSMTPRTKTLYAFGDTPAAKLQTINLQLNRTPGSDAGAMHVLHQMRSSGTSPAPQPAAAGQSASEEEVSEPGGRKRSLNLSQDPISNGGGCASRLRTPPLGSARARLLRLLGACLEAPGGSALPGGEAVPLAAQPLPRVPEPAVSSVTDPAVPLAPAGGACDAGSSRWEAPRPSAPIARPRVRPPTWATTRADAHALYHRMCSGGRRPRRAGDGLRLYPHAQRRRLFLNFTDCVSDLCAAAFCRR